MQPDRTVYVEPSFRAFHEWTPTLLRGAELIADGGTLRAAAVSTIVTNRVDLREVGLPVTALFDAPIS
jgi:hypothetical protein